MMTFAPPRQEQQCRPISWFAQHIYPALFAQEPDVLNKLKVQVSPWLLRKHGVRVRACVQYPGEFVLTLPQSYHCGFSYGFNCGEAVNFAPLEWLAHGSFATRFYRLTRRPPPFSHERLVLTAAARAVDPKDVPSMIAS